MTRLNEGLIPAQAPGSVWGATYSYLDERVVPDKTYYYWLEDVDVYGGATRYGPASAAIQSVTLRLVFLPLVTK